MTRCYHFLLYVTAFIGGAIILVIELMGTRLLAPFFGSGMYTWSTIITVTMAALALGYRFGGRLADKQRGTNALYLLIIIAAVWISLSPTLARHLLPEIVPHLLLWQALIFSSVLLFFPSLFLLAGISPYIIRLLTHSTTEVGSRSGSIFAIATMGSLFGALGSGFYLMANIPVSKTFLGSAWLLSLLAVAGFIHARHRILITSGISLMILFSVILITGVATPSSTSSRIKLIDQANSFYGKIQVIDKDNTRIMLVDGIGQNYVVYEGNYTTPYVEFITALPQLIEKNRSRPQQALVIGVGAGQIPQNFQDKGISTQVVEIDSKIITMAEKHFGLRLPQQQIHIADGRLYASRDRQYYDYLVIDAFSADQIASHLFTVEALIRFRQRLKSNGVLIINITSQLAGDDVASVHHSLREVFPEVHTYAYAYPDNLASHVIIASDKTNHWHSGHVAISMNSSTQKFLANELTQLSSTIILRDDYNPLAEMRMKTSLIWRQEMWNYLGKDNLSWLMY